VSDFSGVVAVVTGAASGIGAATARRLAERGASVAGLDVDVRGETDSIFAVRADVRDQASIDAAVGGVVREFGGIDILVNNAGIGAVGTVEDNDDDEWHRLYDVNVLGIVRLARAALPHLRTSKAGAIVNVSSVAATVGLPERACYGASKGAVLSLTLAMAADLLADGVRVNCVCPGTIDTPWVARLLQDAPDPKARRAELAARQPLGRLGSAPEVADAILYLAAPSASFVTGTALTVDGGLAGLRVPPRR
jgi:NAD(P)-dependent dehydrogenase (short-subunit alcohol dehydrogenase family)